MMGRIQGLRVDANSNNRRLPVPGHRLDGVFEALNL
jgi:hypothetical protein